MNNLKNMLFIGVGAILVGGCGVQIYEYPTGSEGGWFDPAAIVNPVKPEAKPSVTPISSSYNRNPIITSFVANPLNAVNPGDSITFQTDVFDEDHDNLKYTWSATGGTLSTTVGRMVSWTPPARAGVYTILVSISDGRGGSAEGAQNVIVRSNGVAAISGQAAIVNNDDATASVQ